MVLAISIILFGFFIRAVNITKIPVFADEAIYVRWSQVMKAEPTLRFLPQSDGKQPLFMWLTMPALKVFSNPLIAGRMISVLNGVGTMIGIFILSTLLFHSKKAALISLLLYTISPFSFFFHRMALVDATLSLFAVWTAIGGLLTARYLRLDMAMLTGFSLGAAWLTKSPALFFALLMPIHGIFMRKVSLKNVGLYLLLSGVVVVMGYGFYNILRLGPNFHIIASRNLDYVLPYSHIFTNPRDPFIFHVDRALEWIVILGPWPVLVLGFLTSVALLRKYPKQIAWLLILFAFPLLIQAQFAKVFTARYIFFTLPPLFVLSGAFAISHMKQVRIVGYIAVLASVTIGSLNIFKLITNPDAAHLPSGERSGYLSEWTAGQGIYEIAVYIREQTLLHPDKQIVIGTEGYFGTLPDGLQIYLEKVPNVTTIGTGLNFVDVPQSLKDAKKSGSIVYFVANDSRIKFKLDYSEYGLNLISKYQKSLRATDSHEYVVHGPVESLYFFELTR